MRLILVVKEEPAVVVHQQQTGDHSRKQHVKKRRHPLLLFFLLLLLKVIYCSAADNKQAAAVSSFFVDDHQQPSSSNIISSDSIILHYPSASSSHNNNNNLVRPRSRSFYNSQRRRTSRIDDETDAPKSRQSKPCGPAPIVENAVIDEASFDGDKNAYFGDYVWYRCARGWQMLANAGIACNLKGEWFPRLPFCVHQIHAFVPPETLSQEPAPINDRCLVSWKLIDAFLLMTGGVSSSNFDEVTGGDDCIFEEIRWRFDSSNQRCSAFLDCISENPDSDDKSQIVGEHQRYLRRNSFSSRRECLEMCLLSRASPHSSTRPMTSTVKTSTTEPPCCRLLTDPDPDPTTTTSTPSTTTRKPPPTTTRRSTTLTSTQSTTTSTTPKTSTRTRTRTRIRTRTSTVVSRTTPSTPLLRTRIITIWPPFVFSVSPTVPTTVSTEKTTKINFIIINSEPPPISSTASNAPASYVTNKIGRLYYRIRRSSTTTTTVAYPSASADNMVRSSPTSRPIHVLPKMAGPAKNQMIAAATPAKKIEPIAGFLNINYEMEISQLLAKRKQNRRKHLRLTGGLRGSQCLFGVCKEHSSCLNDSQYLVDTVPFPIDEPLKLHYLWRQTARRAERARSGGVLRDPILIWSDELAITAERHAAQCLEIHDDVGQRTAPSLGLDEMVGIGQNICWASWDESMRECVYEWALRQRYSVLPFDDGADIKTAFNTITDTSLFTDLPDPPHPDDHLLAALPPESKLYIGCGKAHCRPPNTDWDFEIVCNYGPDSNNFFVRSTQDEASTNNDDYKSNEVFYSGDVASPFE